MIKYSKHCACIVSDSVFKVLYVCVVLIFMHQFSLHVAQFSFLHALGLSAGNKIVKK